MSSHYVGLCILGSLGKRRMTIIRGQREGKEQGAGKNDSMRKKVCFLNQRGWGVRGT